MCAELTLNPPEGIVAGPINEENFFEWEALITLVSVLLLLNVIHNKMSDVICNIITSDHVENMNCFYFGLMHIFSNIWLRK